MEKPRKRQFESFKSILIAFIAALILRQFVLASYNVPTGSMKDTIMIGDFMFVNKFVYGARTPTWLGIPFTDTGVRLPFFKLPGFVDPEEGDIVVFEYPKKPWLDYIKRCMATGGRSIELRNGEVFVDQKPEGQRHFISSKYDLRSQHQVNYTEIKRENDKNYTIRQFKDGQYQWNNADPVTVPEDHYFMMGDNRDNSEDSRSWGFVPDDLVVGKPLIIWLSWNSYGSGFGKKVRWERLGKVIR
ncbi:MAG: signal peptidase I [Calditrichia bacterium]